MAILLWKTEKGRIMLSRNLAIPACNYAVDRHGNVKSHVYTVDILKFPRRMNQQLLKLSAS